MDEAEEPRSEQEVLEEQLEELLEEEPLDPDEALELATVAALAARLDVDPELMARAEAWRDGPGRELLEEAWDDLDADDLVDRIDALMDGEAEEDDIEDALYDVDEVIAAAIWTDARLEVRDAARRVAASIRLVPDPFVAVADLGSDMVKLPAVAKDLDLYDFWLAVAETEQT